VSSYALGFSFPIGIETDWRFLPFARYVAQDSPGLAVQATPGS
jgi:hypothetical protein